MMHRRTLIKPDGRGITLYGREAIDPRIIAPSPSPERIANNGMHMRWHALRGEWVAYASHRQHRTFLPPEEYDPLAPTRDAKFPTELPEGRYDVAVFDNMFPSLCVAPPPPPELNSVATRAANGACEVIVFSQSPDRSLGDLPLWHVKMILEVWSDRYRELGARDDVRYVMPFENRGVEMGVTLLHPHGQIYAYPFVPPQPTRELDEQRRYWERHGRGLLSELLRREIADGQRLIYEGPDAIAFVPATARYPYEVWIAPRRAAPSLSALSKGEMTDLAKALKTVLLKYDGLWRRPFPYLMVIHEAPTDGRFYPEAHLRIELSPSYRSPGRLKFLAGTELGAGLFVNDSFPEEKARELQAVAVSID